MSTPHEPSPHPDGHGHGRAGSVEAEGTRLVELFREHRLSVRTMDAPLRVATAGAIASLLGAAILVLLRDRGNPVTLGVTDGVLTTLSTPLFLATLVLLALGFGYVLTGAVLGHRVVAVLVVLALTTVIGTETGVLGIAGLHAPLPSWARLTTRLLLAAIWAVALAALFYRRGRHGDAPQDRSLRIALVVVCSALFGGYLGVLRAASPTLHGLDNYPLMISVLMGGLALLAYPILQIAATDFGEWGQFTGQAVLGAVAHPRLGGRLRRLVGVLVPVAACVALVVTGWLLMRGSPGHRLHGMLVELAFAAGIVAVLFAVGRLLRAGRSGWPETVNFAGLFVVVAISLWLVAPVAGWVSGSFKVAAASPVSEEGRFTAAAQVQHVTGPGGATLLVPVGWSATNASADISTYTDTDPRLGRLVLIVGHTSIGSATIQQVAEQLGAKADGEPETEGPRTRLSVTPKAPYTDGVLWVQQPPGQEQAYLFLADATTREPDDAERTFAAVVDSFRLKGQPAAQLPAESEDETPAAAAQANDDRLVAAGVAMQAAISLIALALLAAFGRRWPGRVRITVLLFGVVTVLTACYRADSLGRVVAGADRHWPVLTESGVLTTAGVLGLLALLAAATWGRGTPWAARLPHALTGLAVGILALRLIDVLYNHALTASKVPVWAAIILLVAIAWDVTMSGESMTNHASRLVPRSSRVFLFFGYVILLAAAIVFYSGQHVSASGTAVQEVYFEPEAITRDALFLVALPLLLLIFLLRTFGTPDDEAQPQPNRPRGDDVTANQRRGDPIAVPSVEESL